MFRHYLRSMKFSTKIIVGLLLGILAGLFLGEYAEPFQYVGDAFIGLMQMTVMPYILISLLSNLGKVRLMEQKNLLKAGGLVLVAFLMIGLLAVNLLPFFFPTWESSSFFSTSLVSVQESIDFIGVYIPSNLFGSLSNNVVPAVVLFAIIVGVGLNTTPNKEKIIEALDVFANALNKANKHIVKLTPYGIFGIAAHTAGTLSMSELGLIQVYVGVYTAAVIGLGLILIPLIITATTPFNYRDFLGVPKSSLITIFATGKIIILLPQLIENVKSLFEQYGHKDDEVDSSAELLMPLAYPFPNLGTLVIMVFVPFAAWFAGSGLGLVDQLNFTSSALLSSFVSPIVGIPFLLDTMRLPNDIFELFIVSTAYTDRIRVVLGSIHLFALTVLSIAYAKGLIRIQWGKLLFAFGATIVFFLLLLLPMKHFLGKSFQKSFDKYESFVHMDISTDRVSERRDQAPIDPYVPETINEVKELGHLRVGYLPDALPYVFENYQGKMVGFDVELLHLFAYEIGVAIQWIEIDRDSIAASLNAGKIDLLASGIPILPDRMEEISYSTSYSEINLGLIVPDYKRHDYQTKEDLLANPNAVFATNQTYYLVKRISEEIPELKFKKTSSPAPYLSGEVEAEAMFFSAEAGSAWTLVYPAYCVVRPEDLRIKLPVSWAYAKKNKPFQDYVNNWLYLKKYDGTTERLFNNWIFGEASKKTEPKWSIMRNVLHWVE